MAADEAAAAAAALVAFILIQVLLLWLSSPSSVNKYCRSSFVGDGDDVVVDAPSAKNDKENK